MNNGMVSKFYFGDRMVGSGVWEQTGRAELTKNAPKNLTFDQGGRKGKSERMWIGGMKP